jgi:hypothetical protein
MGGLGCSLCVGLWGQVMGGHGCSLCVGLWGQVMGGHGCSLCVGLWGQVMGGHGCSLCVGLWGQVMGGHGCSLCGGLWGQVIDGHGCSLCVGLWGQVMVGRVMHSVCFLHSQACYRGRPFRFSSLLFLTLCVCMSSQCYLLARYPGLGVAACALTVPLALFMHKLSSTLDTRQQDMLGRDGNGEIWSDTFLVTVPTGTCTTVVQWLCRY